MISQCLKSGPCEFGDTRHVVMHVPLTGGHDVILCFCLPFTLWESGVEGYIRAYSDI